MGLLNFFKKDDKQKKASADIDIHEIKTLFSTPLSERNSKWIDRFNILINEYYFVELIPNNFEDKTGIITTMWYL